MTFFPRPQEIYKHFKGNLYQIVTVATHSETGEQLVIYQALYGDYKAYARPLAMFTGRVDRAKYPEVKQEFRFELQGEGADRQQRESDSTEPCARQTGTTEKQVEEGAKEPMEPIGSKGLEELPKLEDVEDTEELHLDPSVLEFLDADSYEQRLNILAGIHHRITDEMITTMAISCDIEVEDGDTEERYVTLRNCLLTLEKYECNRLR